MKKQASPKGKTLLEPSISDILKILPEKIPHLALTLESAVHMTKLTCVLADCHAEQASNTLSSVVMLFPVPDIKSMAYQAIGEPAIRALHIQNEQASTVAKQCRAQLAQWYAQHPEVRDRHTNLKTDVSGLTDRYTYPLWMMLQILPHDITNVSALDDEQRKMCVAVSSLADQAQNVIWDGLEGLGDLLTTAGQYVPREKLPQLGALMKHLISEARYLAQNAASYWEAACNIPRKEAA